jgi:putative hydroxymethylpyrimidine transport system substrate-binding protein
MTRRPAPLPALLCLALALGLAACGEKREPGSAAAGQPVPAKELRLVLDYLPNADHAGIYAAQQTGAYRRAGLDVRITTPPDPSAPLKLLAAGKADLAISYEPELLLARDQGASLVAVGALVQKPLTSLMALAKAGIRTPQDLRGKRVGTAGIPYQSAYLQTILKTAGVDPATVEETNVGFNLVPAMIAGKVDATLGAFWNVEGVDLARRKRNPVIQRMEKLGVPTYAELVFVARRKALDRDGAELLRRFMQATARGHAALKADPRTGVDGLMKADPGLDRGLLDASVKATLPAFFPAASGQPFGYQDPAAWERYAKWMEDNGLIKRQLNGDAAVSNEFLPGQGLDPGTISQG